MGLGLKDLGFGAQLNLKTYSFGSIKVEGSGAKAVGKKMDRFGRVPGVLVWGLGFAGFSNLRIRLNYSGFNLYAWHSRSTLFGRTLRSCGIEQRSNMQQCLHHEQADTKCLPPRTQHAQD